MISAVKQTHNLRKIPDAEMPRFDHTSTLDMFEQDFHTTYYRGIHVCSECKHGSDGDVPSAISSET